MSDSISVNARGASEIAAHYEFLTKQMNALLNRVTFMTNPLTEVLDNGESDPDIHWSTNPGG